MDKRRSRWKLSFFKVWINISYYMLLRRMKACKSCLCRKWTLIPINHAFRWSYKTLLFLCIKNEAILHQKFRRNGTKQARNRHETATKRKEKVAKPKQKVTKRTPSGLAVYSTYYRKPDKHCFVALRVLFWLFRGCFVDLRNSHETATKQPRNGHETISMYWHE